MEEDLSRVAKANKSWAAWKRMALKEFKQVEARLAAQGGANSFGGAAANCCAANPYGAPQENICKEER